MPRLWTDLLIGALRDTPKFLSDTYSHVCYSHHTPGSLEYYVLNILKCYLRESSRYFPLNSTINSTLLHHLHKICLIYNFSLLMCWTSNHHHLLIQGSSQLSELYCQSLSYFWHKGGPAAGGGRRGSPSDLLHHSVNQAHFPSTLKHWTLTHVHYKNKATLDEYI